MMLLIVCIALILSPIRNTAVSGVAFILSLMFTILTGGFGYFIVALLLAAFWEASR